VLEPLEGGFRPVQVACLEHHGRFPGLALYEGIEICLLYTSDAADERSSV